MEYGVRVLRFADYPVVPWRNGRGVTREIAASVVAAPAVDGLAVVDAASVQEAVVDAAVVNETVVNEAVVNETAVGPAVEPGAVAPATAAPAWRISMATIEEEAPFSRFPGLVRTLGVMDGAGIELTVDGRRQPLLPGEVFGPFSGEAPSSARPIPSPVAGSTHGPAAGLTAGLPADLPPPASAGPEPDQPILDLGLMLDPTRVQGGMRAIGAGEHDLVGLTWFLVALVDGLSFSLNHGDPVALARRDTAALDLRAGPIARLTLSAQAPGPLAYLLSISR